MALIVKTQKDEKRKPHLALTHEMQGGAANQRNVSLLLKSDIEITEDIAKLIKSVTGEEVEVTKASYQTLRNAIQESLDEKYKEERWDWLYVEDFDEVNVIFTKGDGLFYTSYEADGLSVTVGDTATSVNRVVSYRESDGELILSQDPMGLDSSVHSLIVKSFESISNNEKIKDVFKSKLERGKKQMDEIQKAVEQATAGMKTDLEKANADLAKALETIKEFEKQAKEKRDASRLEVVKAVVKDEEKVQEFLKATDALEDEAFDVVVKSLKEKEEQMEGSDLFIQKSTGSEGEDKVPGHVAILQKKYSDKQ